MKYVISQRNNLLHVQYEINTVNTQSMVYKVIMLQQVTGNNVGGKSDFIHGHCFPPCVHPVYKSYSLKAIYYFPCLC